MNGGKRPGAGRPKAPPSVPVCIRLSKEQHAYYMERGGARWIKRLIDDVREVNHG